MISLKAAYPDIAKEWDYEKNIPEKPENVAAGCNKKVFWICDKGHSWQAKVSNRTYNNTGCPYCSGRMAITGENDFVTVYPELANEWNYEKNGDLNPKTLLPNSNKKAWWKCNQGHEWLAQINSRVRGNGCPFCSNQMVLTGFNDLATKRPELILEWDFEKNRDLLPQNITFRTEKKVWWKCEYGHSWNASVYTRSNGHGCPFCKKGLRTSFAEQAVYYYVKKVFPDAINSCKTAIEGKDLDIYIPSRQIAIEYDGEKWHQNIKKDQEKNRLCEEQNIVLYRIRERKCWFWEETEFLKLIPCEAYNFEELNNAINVLLMDITNNLYIPEINIESDRLLIMGQYAQFKKKNNLTITHPDVAKEWNYEKNEDIIPESVKAGSNLIFWWKGKCGHEWKASPANRIKGKGCPICAGKKVLEGFNDLATVKPELAKEWNYEKNNDLLPNSVTPGSNKKVWWKCHNGHEWIAQISSRSHGRGCPFCNDRVEKNVMCVETGKIYKNATEAAKIIGLKSRKSISQCCLGKRNTAANLHWEYV